MTGTSGYVELLTHLAEHVHEFGKTRGSDVAQVNRRSEEEMARDSLDKIVRYAIFEQGL